MIWEPFNPASYFLHIGFGVIATVGAITALAVVKGSQTHIRAGRVFAVAMSVAALTAFSLALIGQFSPNAVISAAFTLYAIGTGVLALRPQTDLVKTGERAFMFVAGFLALAPILAIAAFDILPETDGVTRAQVAQFVIRLFGPFAVLSLLLLIFDFRFLSATKVQQKKRRVRRHLVRVSLAATEILRALGITFSRELGLPFPLVYFGPFILAGLMILIYWKRASALGTGAK